jgi:hypothetical protein
MPRNKLGPFLPSPDLGDRKDNRSVTTPLAPGRQRLFQIVAQTKHSATIEQ